MTGTMTQTGTAMLDWLRRDPRKPPGIAVDGRELPVAIRRLAHARRMTLRLAPDGSEARVTIPRWCGTAEALAFAQSRREWLERQLAALPSADPPRPGGRLLYRGAWLAIEHCPGSPRQVLLGDGQLRIGGPEDTIAPRLRRWLEGSAREVLGEDLAHYCNRAGREAPRLALSRAQRRWGSCGPDGAIRINWRLIMAPDPVRRSVVAHEVAHLLHFDHSPRFHAALDELYEGDLDEANRWLRSEGRSLYRGFG